MIHDGFEPVAMAFPLQPSHFESIHKIGVKLQLNGAIDRDEAVIIDLQALVTRPVPEELGAEDVQRAAGHGQLPVGGEIGVTEVDRKKGIVILHGRTEEQGAVSPQLQRAPREEPHPLMLDPLFAWAKRSNIAVAVEHGKRFAMLEHPGTIISQGGGGQGVVLIFHTNDVVQRSLLTWRMKAWAACRSNAGRS